MGKKRQPLNDGADDEIRTNGQVSGSAFSWGAGAKQSVAYLTATQGELGKRLDIQGAWEQKRQGTFLPMFLYA